ncbi:hypothetical protein SLEP1_g25915 [Rubroshorea leprosula]|uniref:Uncharacterized protein n=1 Tax=Rubroshorea leprosula TaxID=152421 RepID=A0AAV5JXX2_9ROSI|nr:hypothetical protein SLEP1_g25915 [Rubroshorea leprosula]
MALTATWSRGTKLLVRCCQEIAHPSVEEGKEEDESSGGLLLPSFFALHCICICICIREGRVEEIAMFQKIEEDIVRRPAGGGCTEKKKKKGHTAGSNVVWQPALLSMPACPATATATATATTPECHPAACLWSKRLVPHSTHLIPGTGMCPSKFGCSCSPASLHPFILTLDGSSAMDHELSSLHLHNALKLLFHRHIAFVHRVLAIRLVFIFLQVPESKVVPTRITTKVTARRATPLPDHGGTVPKIMEEVPSIAEDKNRRRKSVPDGLPYTHTAQSMFFQFPDCIFQISAIDSNKKHKGSVFSRICFPEEEANKGCKLSSEPASSSAHDKAASNCYYNEHKSSSSAAVAKAVSTGVKKSSSSAIDYESSDDERHFKRKPSSYESSLPPMAEREDEPRHSKWFRE